MLATLFGDVFQRIKNVFDIYYLRKSSRKGTLADRFKPLLGKMYSHITRSF